MMPHFMMRMMNRLMFSCEKVTELVSLSLDQNLPLPQRLKMRMHFVICVLCSRYREQIAFLRTALRSHADRLEDQATPPPTGLSHQARERIKSTLTRP